MKSTIYIDTVDWINFILAIRNNKFNAKTLDLRIFDPQKAEILISDINLIEISEKLADEKRLNKYFQQTLSILQVRKADLDKQIITKEDLLTINEEISKTILNLPTIVTDRTPSISSEMLRFLTEICLKYSIFFIDALHFTIADELRCNYFITSDIDLFKKTHDFLRDINYKDGLQIMTAKRFKDQELYKFVINEACK